MKKRVNVDMKIVDTLISFDILMEMLTEEFMTGL